MVVVFADILNLTDAKVQAALVAASAAIVVAVVGGLINLVTGRRERRRTLYSQAYKTAMAWNEMLYRVRRRAIGTEASRTLIDRFHELQEEMNFHEGWIRSESVWMGRSYARLVKDIKAGNMTAIQDAWKEPIRRAPSQGTSPGDAHFNPKDASRRFLFDVRMHLSFLVVPRLLVVWSNRQWFGG